MTDSKAVTRARRETSKQVWATLTPEQREHRTAGLRKWAAGNSLRRTYDLDEHYFDQIDTPEKAYWLGFIAGDGCVSDDGCLTVALAAVDAGHLESLASALRTTSPVRHTLNSARGRTFKRASLAVYSRYMTQALGRHGILPRKSLTLEPWDGPADLLQHYWRGLVDADGTIGKEPSWRVALVGTRPIVAAFGDWAQGIAPTSTAQPRPRGKIWRFSVNGRVAARSIVQVLYSDCTAALPRKAARAAALIATGPAIRGTPEWRAAMSLARQGWVPSQANRDAHRTAEYRERSRQRALARRAS